MRSVAGLVLGIGMVVALGSARGQGTTGDIVVSQDRGAIDATGGGTISVLRGVTVSDDPAALSAVIRATGEYRLVNDGTVRATANGTSVLLVDSIADPRFTVTNRGIIQGFSDPANQQNTEALAVGGFLTLDNALGARISTDGFQAITVGGAANIVNRGLITGLNGIEVGIFGPPADPTVIRNSGQIIGTGDRAVLIHNAGGAPGLVVNEAGGVIRSETFVAVDIEAQGRVENSGTIQGPTAVNQGGVGIVIGGKTGTQVQTELVNNVSGIITCAGTAAVSMFGFSTVTNAGTINGRLLLNDTNGSSSVVTNSGKIFASNDNAVDFNTVGTLFNQAGGNISGSLGTLYNFTGTGTNDGTITGTGDPNAGGGDAVQALSDLQFTNTGKIDGTGRGIGVSGEGRITNRGTILGRSLPGIDVSGLGVIDNFGTITSTGTGSSAINVGGRGFITNTGGSIVGPADGFGLSVGDASLIISSGRITGGRSMSLSPNDDAVILKTGAVVTGDMLGGAGRDSLALDGSGTLNANALDFETFGKREVGTWTVNSTLNVAEIGTVDAGTLVMNGTFNTALFFVLPGATLKGTGTITGDVANSGIFAPGNSPGTFNLPGNFRNNPDGTIIAELATNTAFDRILVGGTTTLAGTLIPAIGLAGTGSYDIIASGAGITGNFDRVLAPTSAVLSVTTEIVAGPPDLFRVNLVRNTYTSLAGTPEESILATALDGVLARAVAAGGSIDPGTAGSLLHAIDLLPDRASVNAALDRLGPLEYDAHKELMFIEAHHATDELERRLELHWREARAPRTSASAGRAGGAGPAALAAAAGAPLAASVASPVASPTKTCAACDESTPTAFLMKLDTHADQDPHNGALGIDRTGFDLDAHGGLIGLEWRRGEHGLFGFFGGGGDAKAELDRGRGFFHADDSRFGAFASYGRNRYHVDASYSVASYDFFTLRDTSFPGFTEIERAVHGGRASTAYLGGALEVGYGAWQHGPIASLTYTDAKLDAFDELGGVARLSVGERDVHSLRSTLGWRAGREYTCHTARVSPDFRLRWAHEVARDSEPFLTAFAATGPGPFFAVPVASPERDSVFAGAGVTVNFENGNTLFAGYDADLGRNGIDTQAVRAGASVRF